MVILQSVVLFLTSFNLVLAQPYTLSVAPMGNPTITLLCLDSSTNVPADIDDVKFWRNRFLRPNDPGLREGGDIPVFEDQARNWITFTVTREFEGRYTCGREQTGTIVESPPILLVSLQIFNSLVDPFDETFYAISQSQAILHCPIQPGALVEYYYGRWERNGDIIVEIPQPINGNPQEIVRSESRLDLNRTSFSLLINSVEPADASDNYQCFLYVVNPLSDNSPMVNLQTDIACLSLIVNVEPEILSKPNYDVIAFHDNSEDQLPSFTCVAAGLPPPTITWTYIPNLDREHKIFSLSDGESYQIVVNVSKRNDGRQETISSATLLELSVTDGGLVRCRTSSPMYTSTASADALLTVIGKPDHIGVLVTTKGEFIYDVALPVLLQHPVKLNISYVDQNHQVSSHGRLTTMEYNDTDSILYREKDIGHLPFEKYFVRISIVAEFQNKRIEGPPCTSTELIDTTKPYAEVVIFGLSGGVATTLLIILVILPCITAIGCCVYHKRKGCCDRISCYRVSENSKVV